MLSASFNRQRTPPSIKPASFSVRGDEEEADFVFGLNLILTNRLSQAEDFFSKRSSSSSTNSSNNNAQLEHCKRVHATFGYALISVLKALVSFEEDEKQVALNRLYHTQKLAASGPNSFAAGPGAWGARLFSSAHDVDPLHAKYAEIVDLIAADAGMFIAILQFMSESAIGFMKGTFSLRKSYKVYQKACPSLCSVPPALLSPSSSHRAGELDVNLPKSLQHHNTSTRVDVVEGELFFDCFDQPNEYETGYGPLIAPDTLLQDRIDAFALLGSGIFTLSFSMIPPRLQPVIGKAVGFDIGNNTTTQQLGREDGLRLLVASMNKRTSRAPIAALILLTFHTAMLIMSRSGGAVDKDTTSGGEAERTATRVLEECLVQYPDSPMFRLLEGRLLRGKARVREALRAFEISEYCSHGMNALHHLSLYERAWCEGLLGDYHRAGELFSRVAKDSAWSPAFYSYLAASFYFEYAYRILCLGQESVLGSRNSAKRALYQAMALFRLVPTAVRTSKRGGNIIPPELLAQTRALEFDSAWTRCFPNITLWPDDFNALDSADLVRLFDHCPFSPSLELCYVWNALFQAANKEQLLVDLSRASNAGNAGAACRRLYRGSLFRELGRYREALVELSSAEIKSSTWVLEFSKLEQGLCHLQLGDKAKAAAYFNSVADSGHPMDSRLKFRLKAAMSKV